MARNNKQNKIVNLFREELKGPFIYKSKKDFEFVSALMSCLKKILPNETTHTNVNITFWWKQKIFCITNPKIKKGDDTWYPDAFNGKCIIETYEIKNETNEEWRARKKSLLEYYASSISAYHEGMFFCFVKRIDSNLYKEIYNQYFGEKRKQDEKS